MRRQPLLICLLLIAALILTQAALAAASRRAGGVDATFDPGSGANNFVFAMARQNDGQVLIGGQFTEVNQTARNGIARLNANGSLDMTYGAGVNMTGYSGVASLALQADGKAVIGGLFSQVNGVARASIARLNVNGALDDSFNAGVSAADGDAYLNIVVLQADGKPVIGGVFTGASGGMRNNIARLTSSGALDATFAPGKGANGEVSAIAIQPADGKVLIGGDFSAVNDVTHRFLARLNANGSLDSAFNPELNGMTLAIALQPDGKILIGGAFTLVNNVARARIARLNANGSLDTTFDPGAGANNEVDAIALQPDGKILVGGKFTTLGDISRARVARLNANGALDSGYDPGGGASYTVYALAIQPDGKALIGGGFGFVDDVPRNGIARLCGDTMAYLPLLLRR
jgi:uncharacterized delta-60 repeat protein